MISEEVSVSAGMSAGRLRATGKLAMRRNTGSAIAVAGAASALVARRAARLRRSGEITAAVPFA